MSKLIKTLFGTDIGTDEVDEAIIVKSEDDAFSARQSGLLCHHEFKKDQWHVASQGWYKHYRNQGGIWVYE